ncbi:MAG: class I SAM-dependent methyltransferase [Planctomycetes bacterium]|nr:class I SAM-dependent methyltransferase [Planctomycetota bacterium]
MDLRSYTETRYTPDPRRDGVWREVARYLRPYIREDAAVLELGAGYCSFINSVRASKRFALDLNESVRRHAGPGVEPRVGSCTSLAEFPDGTMDVVIASNLLEHLSREDASRTLKEARRVLRAAEPRGSLILIQPNFRYAYRDYFDDFTHETIWTDLSLRDFTEAHGFAVSRLEPKFLPFSMKSGLPAAPWLVRLYLLSPLRPRAGQMLLVARTV